MAESFLTLMADYDMVSQFRMDGWYNALQHAGFTGTQTPGLNHHISLATFPLEEEAAAIELTQRIAVEFAPVDVHISHVGLFRRTGTLCCAGNESGPRGAAEGMQRRPHAEHASLYAPHYHADR